MFSPVSFKIDSMAKSRTPKPVKQKEKAQIIPSPYYTYKELNLLLPTVVAEKYSITPFVGKRTTTRVMTASFGIVDFKNLTLKEAERLVKRDCPFIIEK